MNRQLFSSLLLCFLMLAFAGHAQVLKPVKWQSSIEPKEAKIGEVVSLVFTATIQADWYLYSSDFDPDLGPNVTVFSFEAQNGYELVGGLQPIKPKKKYDDLWEGEYTYFEGTGVFKQQVRILKKDFKIAASMKGQTCTDVTGKCIPIEEDFSFDASQLKLAEAENKVDKGTSTEKTENATTTKALESTNAKPSVTTEKEVKDGNADGEATADTVLADSKAVEEAKTEKPAEIAEINDDGEFSASSNSGDMPLFLFLLTAFLAGITAVFTPCVFPMIPMTVSFFSKGKGKTQALVYGLSIVGIYGLIGAISVPIFGVAGLNSFSTHWATNLIFFTTFVVFALSFFGMFDIELPNSFVNKMDKMADKKGGLLGVFFMAFTLVIVSFSCTGPIAGSLLIASASGETIRPILGMSAFGFAFGLPFVIFALFPSLLSNLPKSGGWLNVIKVSLGFIELALAFKFLSMIDLVYHLGILDRDLNIAIWIGIFSFMGLYYLGKIQLPHDSPIDKISVPRMLLALASFVFVIYLIPGMFGAPLKSLSGVLPPTATHDFDLHKVIRENAGSGAAKGENVLPPAQKYADLFHMPHGFAGYFDYEEGLAVARKTGRPVMLDFTGHGCANCRKMEDNVWIDPAVRQRLQNDWVIIELYVDDPTPLPEAEWVKSTYDGKIKKTIGAVNMDYEVTRFDNNAQPLYVLLDHQGNLLSNGMGYDADIPNFIQFLDNGLKEFKRRK